MIEGLKIHVRTSELREHLAERVTYHRGKAHFYRQQADALAEGAVGRNRGASNDPVESLMQSERSHTQRAGFFAFLVEHLVPDETYELSEQDLIRLEFVARHL